jgi:hypothetical protein
MSELLRSAEGLPTIASGFGPQETMDRLEAEIRAHGMNVFARIDHAAGAAEVWANITPDRTRHLWQCARRDALDAVGANGWNRSAVESTRLAGCCE